MFPVKVVAHRFVKASSPFPDWVCSTFHHLSSVRTSNTHFSLGPLFSSGILAGSLPSSSGSLPVATGRLLVPVLWPLLLSNLYFIQFSQPFQNVSTYIILFKVNLWLSLLSNTERIYYLCFQSPLKYALSLFSILPVLNPLQQAERLLFLQHTSALCTLPFLHDKCLFFDSCTQCCWPAVFWNSSLHIHFFFLSEHFLSIISLAFLLGCLKNHLLYVA